MRPNFNIVEEKNSDFWDKYEQFIQLWNDERYTVKEIREILGISLSKYYQYRDKGFNENRLDKELRSPRQSSKRGHYLKKIKSRGDVLYE